jgi:hypothetical protein
MSQHNPTSASASEQTVRGSYSPSDGAERIATASLRLPVAQPILTSSTASSSTVGYSLGLVFGNAGWRYGLGITFTGSL